MSRILELRKTLEAKEQPANWGTKSASVTATLMSWNSFFGTIILTEDAPAGVGDQLLITIAEAISDMKYVRGRLSAIVSAMNKSSWKIKVNCQDTFLTDPEEKEGKDEAGNTIKYRVFKDSRTTDSAGTVKVSTASSMCQDSTKVSAWTFYNDVTAMQEMTLCPSALSRWGETTLTSTANSQSALKAKKLNALKRKAGAEIILHELTHSKAIHGQDKKTRDETFPVTDEDGNEKEVQAYGFDNVRGLAFFDPAAAITNADSYGLFALDEAMYYDACVWDEGVCTGVDKSGTFTGAHFDY
ncbi:uncharacterized protein DSM5745_10190 [Aspergillus mulundensis]|uniref:Lysine-specific metallo-endopeptidase domain-containing protein n=1 Tax=Aspergillus mulundensis TaxID=1810919 RepID=A0A3D8QMR1_9EURO|nr:hypothetical protein DSM5745_10190 [Aspergillus mulundensis]RDW63079.1 hypothetical protein DSM5745_10190 [Aspergillus mulundensis]